MYHHPSNTMGVGPPPPPPPDGSMIMGQAPQQLQQKHDIFVGNLAFSTTEEQLHQAFSEIGRLVKVRMVNDLDTGKPRGFAFIEFEDPQAALSAIRNMNDYELNGRRIRVNFSNSSHLEALAGKLGMDLSQHNHSNNNPNNSDEQKNPNTSLADKNSVGPKPGTGTNDISTALLNMSKGEMYDVISQLKQTTEKDPEEARKILCGHPQLPEAILFLMSKLDMIRTPLETIMNVHNPAGMPVSANINLGIPPPKINLPLPPQNHAQAFNQPPPSRISDPRGNLADPRAALSDPRAAQTRSTDPRSLTRDPRAASLPSNANPPTSQTSIPSSSISQPPPQPPHKLNISAPPPSMPIPPPHLGIMGMGPNVQPPHPPYNVNVPPPSQNFAQPPPQQQQQQQAQTLSQATSATQAQTQQNTAQSQSLDTNLVQRVLSLTPQEIARLPHDKQQSILALRQQITGGR